MLRRMPNAVQAAVRSAGRSARRTRAGAARTPQQQAQPAPGGEIVAVAGGGALGDSPASTSTRRAKADSVAGGSPTRATSMVYEYDPDYIERRCWERPPAGCPPVLNANALYMRGGSHFMCCHAVMPSTHRLEPCIRICP